MLEGLKKRLRPGESVIGAILFFCGIISIFTTIGLVFTLGIEAGKLFLEEQVIERPSLPEDFVRVGRNAEGDEVFKEAGANDDVESGYRCIALDTGDYECIKHATITEFLTSTSWFPGALDFGVLPLLVATLITSSIAIAVALPLGLAAAIYLSEYASSRTRRILKPTLEILAGIPTVVYGYFALTFMTPVLRGAFTPETVKQFNMASAGLVMGVMILPLVASMSEDALSSVPRALREGAAGLGSTKLETTVRVILPAAISGIVAALIISISRAVGETMIVAVAAGAGPNYTFVPFESAETMTGHIARISGGDISYGSIDYNSLFAIGFFLFAVTLILNIIGRVLVRRFREVYE